MGKHEGKCAICGRITELTFEHIPPEATYNSTPAKPVSGKQLLDDPDRLPWNTKGLRYENQQRGMGKYSLCGECNNNTGAWYGAAYTEFARIAGSAIKNLSREENAAICIKKVYPARIIKQVLAMFCSILPREQEAFDDIRAFVLDREAVGLDKDKYKVCMYFTDSQLMKYNGLTVMCKFSDTFQAQQLSEITAYPLGFILYYEPNPEWIYQGTDITEFADCKYDDLATIRLPWVIQEMNGLFPEDYRSKEEIIECIEEAKRFEKEHPDL